MTVPLTDSSGNTLTVNAVSYKVTDENGVSVVGLTPLATFVSGDAEVVIATTALQNTLAAGVLRGLRAISIVCEMDAGSVELTASYAIGASDPLVVGVNSFQTLSQAEFLSMEIPNTPGWDGATAQQRVAALIEARKRINMLSFNQLNSNVNWGQDSLNYVPEGQYTTSYVSNNGMFLFNGNLELLRADQFAKLPAKFLDAIRRGQLVEADEILGGDPIQSRRQAGILVDTIGETKMMFKTGKPLQLPVSRRALAYMSYFITFSKRLTRAA